MHTLDQYRFPVNLGASAESVTGSWALRRQVRLSPLLLMLVLPPWAGIPLSIQCLSLEEEA